MSGRRQSFEPQLVGWLVKLVLRRCPRRGTDGDQYPNRMGKDGDYTSQYVVTTGMTPALRRAAMRPCSLIMRGKVSNLVFYAQSTSTVISGRYCERVKSQFKTVSAKSHILKRKDSRSGIELRSFFLPAYKRLTVGPNRLS